LTKKEEKKTIVYEIHDEKIIDDMEQEIAEHRKVRLTEEAKNEEIARNEARKKKKAQEAKDKRRFYGKFELQSYDYAGKMVEMINLAQLPNLVPKCGKAVNLATDVDKSSPKQTLPKNTQSLTNNKKPQSILSSYLEEIMMKTKPKEPIVKYPNGAYDAFVPQFGVTFTESGKNPKFGMMTISQHTGKISKSEFHTLVSESTTSGFFPALKSRRSGFVDPVKKVSVDYNKTTYNPIIIENSNTPSNIVEATQKYSQTWKNLNSSEVDNVEITGDMSQLIIEGANQTTYSQYYGHHPSESVSVLPNEGFPHLKSSFTQGVNKQSENEENEKNPVDVFNMNMLGASSGRTGSGIHYKPIEKGFKAKKKQFIQSIGIFYYL